MSRISSWAPKPMQWPRSSAPLPSSMISQTFCIADFMMMMPPMPTTCMHFSGGSHLRPMPHSTFHYGNMQCACTQQFILRSLQLAVALHF